MPIVLAQYKNNERIGEARTLVRRASPIVIQLAYKFRCTDRKQKYIQYETMANKKFKIMPSATVSGQYPMIGAILDPPLFSLDTTFKQRNRTLPPRSAVILKIGAHQLYRHQVDHSSCLPKISTHIISLPNKSSYI